MVAELHSISAKRLERSVSFYSKMETNMSVNKSEENAKSAKEPADLKTQKGFKDRGLDPKPYGKGLK